MSDPNNPSLNDAEIAEIESKYAQEAAKRRRGVDQFVQLRDSESNRRLLEDPWIETGTPIHQVVQDGGHCRFLIVGAGWGGILFAVHLVKAGFSPKEIVIVDHAGGFGGVWYWHRYPGIMCDVESYIYMPLLEEMDYMPKHKYASGEEIRLYAESICQKYELSDRAMFQSRPQKMSWDEKTQEWKVSISRNPKGKEGSTINISADYILLANGLFDRVQLPKIEGIDLFNGDMFHTSRWRYDVTGGSPDDASLIKLQGKKVGVVGNSASGVQVVPRLAEWAQELHVFMRTPSSVDARGNCPTDPEEWVNEIANKPGWQQERNENWLGFLTKDEHKPSVDLVNDGWTRMPTYSALLGSPSFNVTPETAGQHVAELRALDHPRQERIRQRIKSVVQDPETAASLQPWYFGWCKRPCFHDEYLQAFNHPNVKLVDTEGKGIDRLSSKGIVAGGKEHELDVIVWASGYTGPGIGNFAQKAGIELTGRGGESISNKFDRNGVSTLHGVTTRGFPNLFFVGGGQSGSTANFTFGLDVVAKHVAYIVGEASRRGDGKAVIEATAEGERQWTARILQGVAFLASVQGCTPGFFNSYGAGETLSPEQRAKAARGAPWSKGVVDYMHVLEAWRSGNQLEGLHVEYQPR